MNPTSHAAMSGGWAVTGRRGVRGITRSAQALARKNGDTPRVACRGLDDQGVADPELTEMNSAVGCHLTKNGLLGGAKRKQLCRRRDRLKGQPQQHQHSAAVLGGTRDRLPPGEAFRFLLREGSLPKAETRHPAFRICGAR